MTRLWAMALFVALFGAVPCAAQSTNPCDKAYAAKRWDDVLQACADTTQNTGHTVTTTAGLSNADKRVLYEQLVSQTIYIARAYAALGDPRMAQVNLKKADLWLQLAESVGLSSDSEQYKALYDAIEQAQAAASPQPY